MENWERMPKKTSYEQYTTYLTSLLGAIEKAKNLDETMSISNYEQYFNIIVRKWLESEIKPKVESPKVSDQTGVLVQNFKIWQSFWIKNVV